MPAGCVGGFVSTGCHYPSGSFGCLGSPCQHPGGLCFSLGALGGLGHVREVSPSDPSSLLLGSFFAWLSSTFHLSASSVRVHRASVCTIICQMGGPDFAFDPLLRDVARGVALSEARAPRRVSAWDLFIVPSADWHSLSLKTVFLVTLASGVRSPRSQWPLL